MRGGREGGEVVEHRLRRGRAERSGLVGGRSIQSFRVRLERRSSISKRSSSRVANEPQACCSSLVNQSLD